MHASVCDQLHDLVQNAMEAGASWIKVCWLALDGWLEITVEDDGCGMDTATVARAIDPFFTDGRKHRHRRVGLGLAFLRQMVEETGGHWELASELGRGTRLHFRLNQAHVDMPPQGDVVGSLVGLMAFAGDYELVVQRKTEVGAYTLRRSDLREALGDLETATSLGLMREYIASQEEALQKG